MYVFTEKVSLLTLIRSRAFVGASVLGPVKRGCLVIMGSLLLNSKETFVLPYLCPLPTKGEGEHTGFIKNCLAEGLKIVILINNKVYPTVFK